MPKTTLPSLKRLQQDFPQFSFKESDTFYWSAAEETIYYAAEALESSEGSYQLLHELGHALCGHKTFVSGVNLIRLETDAWAAAQKVAKEYGSTISQKHIEACLDTYRDWLFLRSSCPACKATGVETEDGQYRCFNCFTCWKVSKHQQRRCYRLTVKSEVVIAKSPS